MKLLPVILLLLSGCAAPLSSPSAAKTLVYDCGGGYRLTIRDENKGFRIFLPSGTHLLKQVPSASGVRYAGKGVEFWSKGDEAFLETSGQVRRQCRSDRVAALWEDAKFRGVDFRAVGNEPGWYLELDSEKIVYAGNYGQQFLTFTYAPPQLNDSRAQTIFNALSADDHQLEMKLQAGRCIDSMSGAKFGTRVTLKLDGHTFYGCGRALH